MQLWSVGKALIAISQLADTGLRHPHHPGGNAGQHAKYRAPAKTSQGRISGQACQGVRLILPPKWEAPKKLFCRSCHSIHKTRMSRDIGMFRHVAYVAWNAWIGLIYVICFQLHWYYSSNPDSRVTIVNNCVGLSDKANSGGPVVAHGNILSW